MIATSGFLTALECTKFVFGRGSAPDPAGGAHDAPPDPLVGWGGGYPLPIPHPLDAFGVSVSSPTATRPRAFGARSSTPPAVVISPPKLGSLDKTLGIYTDIPPVATPLHVAGELQHN